jgi:hypothetical protein
MIKNFKIFEYQMKLFKDEIDLKPTDTEIANSFIDKYKIKKKFKRPTNYGTLQQAFDTWSTPEQLNQVIYDEMDVDGGLCETSLGIQFLANNQDDLVEYIIDDPDLITDWFKNELENDFSEENINKEINDNYDEWYYRLEDIFKNPEKFEEYLLEKHKNNLFQQINTDDYEKLESIIYNSDEPNRLLIHRAITLPVNIKELEEIDETGVGVYWTYDYDKAESYNSKYNREFVFSVYADVNCIDWEQTIRRSLYSLSEEKEVNVYEGADLELVSVYLKDYHENYEEDIEHIEQLSKLSKMFHHKKDNEIRLFLNDKRKNQSIIQFDPPVQITA